MTSTVDQASPAEEARAAALAKSEGEARMFEGMVRDDDAEARERIMANIRRLELERNVFELDMQGYTVVAPDRAGPPGFADRLRKRILEISEERAGFPPDLETGASHAGFSARGQTLNCILPEDPVFQEVVVNPIQLALMDYLLGEHCILGGMSACVKGPSEGHVPLHTDQHTPQPYPAYAQTANCTWTLTPYTVDDGCLAMAPGSHKFCRMPKPFEGLELAVPVEVPAGSLIVWHGNQWHGAYPRTNPGLRINLLQYYQRPYLVVLDDLSGVTPEMLVRNGPRFARLMGDFLPWGFRGDGIPHDKAIEAFRACHNLFY
jgi:hypothetical protein